MKKTNILVFIIAIFLFFIPFFWLKPGEMNLGGDSGRLYFYDPLSYLKYYTLYVYSSSGAGNEIFSYSSLFYTSVLFIFKLIFSSSTVVISIFNGIVLSWAFLSIYFIVRELLNNFKNPIKESVVVCSSILAGFLYIFSQLSIYSGWENSILSHNQIFLNPFIFLLLLQYLITRKKLHMYTAILISVVFSANFSFQGAPTFFAFYPLSLAFLICYAKFIKKLSIPFKELTFGSILFLLAHSFHLIPEIARLFSFGSSLSKTVFIQEGAYSRMGLDYFIAVASSVKVSLIWLSAAQSQHALIFSILIIFPITFILGFYFNRGKTLLLTGIFFLVAMYFTSANITDTGFFFYKLLFKIPGFSMFRNYHGQWLYVYFFFYALVFGQTFAIIASKLSRRLLFIFFLVFSSVILGFGMPLITGAASIVIHENGIRYAFRMDPIYEKVLDYFKKYPIDAKIMTLPLTSPGFQIFQGKDGGIYQGIPTISFLSGKSDFSGFETLRPFHEIFIQAMYDKNYEVLKKILLVLNIHHIFYNSDPYIYSDNFQAYLYNYFSKFSPKDQKEYKKFVEKIAEGNRIDFGKNYHIYSLKTDTYLPHIFIATEALYTNNQLSLSTDQYFSNDLREIPLATEKIANNKDRVFLYAQPENPFGQLINNSHLHKHEPFIYRKLSDLLYALTSVKEHFELFKLRNDPAGYMDLNLLFLEKRILELNKFGEEIPILKTSWHEPKPWEFYNWSKYNSWDAGLARYQQNMEKLIDWVNNKKNPEIQKNENKIKISEQLYHHQVELLRSIISLNRKNEEKTYIYSLANSMFKKLFQKIQLPIYDPSIYQYRLPLYSNFGNSFNVFLAKRNFSNNTLMNAYIEINDQVLKLVQAESNDRLLAFTNYSKNENREEPLSLHLQPENLAKDIKWSNSGESVDADKSTTFIVSNNIGDKTKGLILDIPDWISRNQYLISFEYMSSGDDFLFSFYDKKQINDTLKKRSYKLFFEKILNSTDWKTHQSIISAEDESTGAFLQFAAFSTKDKSKLRIRNLLITKISYPEIIFKKLSSGDTPQTIPKIIFTKINSTKYRINVTDAVSPYTLVFLEAFSGDWKLFNPEKDTDSIRGFFSRFFGSISKKIVGIFIKEDENKQIIASYFNGEVKEGKHTNTFLAPNTFETWGKGAVADKRHFLAFEYANAWSINPEDVDGKTDYTLILEFVAQKKFYPALFLSLLTLLCIITYMVKIRIFNK